MAKSVLTVAEVSTLLQLGERTVRRLIHDGEIPAFRLGERGQLRIRRVDLEALIRERIADGQR